MDYVIRRRKSGSMKRGIIQPLEINCNRELMMLDNDERIELLSPASAAFHKPDFNIHVLAIMGVKVPVNVELLKAKFPSTLCKHPRFSSVVEGNPCKGEKLRWTRTEVNLDKHIIVPKINLESIDSPEKYVEDYIYNLSKTTLDKSRPLWDIHVLNLKLSEDVKAVTVFRVHHSLGDGTSLISLLLALTRKTSDPEALPTIPASKLCNDDNNNNNNNNTRKGLFWKWAIALWMILKLFWNTSIDILLFVATTLFLKDNCPFKSSPEGANAPRRVVYKIFSLDDMKFVKNAIGGTINDVAVGITQAGLSQYLYRKYGNKGDTNEDTRGKMKRFLSNIRLRSVLLVNIRPSGGVQALADMMEKDAEVKWGNSVGFMLLPFTLGLHDDPLDYIRDAKTRVDKKKHSFEAIYTFFMAEIVMKFFGSKVASVISDRINSHTTMGFSNLPGPVEDVAFYGLPLAFVAPSSYGQPHAVLINFQSYSDKMTIVLAVDEYTVPDPHQLCDDIVDSLKLIKDAVIKQVYAAADVSEANVGVQDGRSQFCSIDLASFLPPPYGNLSYSSCHPVWETFVLRYYQSNDNKVTIVLSALYTAGWVGIGFSKDGLMVGGSAMVGWISKSGHAKIKQYYLKGRKSYEVLPGQGDLNMTDIPPVVVLNGANLYLGFQLQFNAPVVQQPTLLAYGSRLPLNHKLTVHDDKTTVYIDYSTVSGPAAASDGGGLDKMKRSHGLLGMLGWGLFLPCGAIVARFLKHKEPLWYYLHTVIQFIGFLIIVAGVMVGQTLYDRIHPDIAAHRGIGYFALTLSIMQVLAFFIRPGKESKMRRLWAAYHRWFGVITLFFGALNIVLGIQVGGAGSDWKIGYGFLLGFIIVTVIVLQALSMLRRSEKPPQPPAYQMS